MKGEKHWAMAGILFFVLFVGAMARLLIEGHGNWALAFFIVSMVCLYISVTIDRRSGWRFQQDAPTVRGKPITAEQIEAAVYLAFKAGYARKASYHGLTVHELELESAWAVERERIFRRTTT